MMRAMGAASELERGQQQGSAMGDESMQARIRRRFELEGESAEAMAANPYRTGTAAAVWWQRGREKAAGV